MHVFVPCECLMLVMSYSHTLSTVSTDINRYKNRQSIILRLCFVLTVKASVHFESLVVSVVECLSVVISDEVHLIPCDELHMSVSRTVPIRHYWIDPIVQQLRNGLSTLHR